MGRWFLCIVFLGILTKITAQVFEITGQPIVVNVQENETQRVTLHEFGCTTPSGGKFSIENVAINPTFPCGNCFDVIQETEGGPFRLFFLPSKGTANFGQTRTYNMSVVCVDDVLNETSANVEIRVVTNHLPQFQTLIDNSCGVDGRFTAAGTIIHRVIATDDDNDALNFTMTVQPAMTIADFYIDREGIIRNRYNMERVCTPTISFRVFVTDFRSPTSVGPALVTCTVFNNIFTPSISNLNREVSLQEDTAISTLVTMNTLPTVPIVYYDIETFPANARWNFRTDNNNLNLVQPLSFEDPNLQVINVTVTAYNEFCISEPYFLLIRVTDINDVPQLIPDLVYMSVEEGTINAPFTITLRDEDRGDTHVYDIIGGNLGNRFEIDPATRNLVYSGTYDVDQSRDPENVTLIIRVTDSAGATANATLRVRIEDINDNAPVISPTRYEYTIQGCSYTNTVFGTITATDDDSSRNGNNRIAFVPACDGPLCVATDGTIYANALVEGDMRYGVTVHAVDHGTNPGTRQSLTPASVTLSTSICPTTAAATTVATSNTNSNSNSNTNTNTNTNTNSNSNSASSSSSSSSSGTSTTTTGSGTLDAGTIAAIVGGSVGILLLILLGLFLVSKFCPSAFASLKTCCCGNSPSPEKKPPKDLKPKEKDYWRPPSEPSRNQRRVSPQNPRSAENADNNKLFDFWGDGKEPANNAGRPKAATNIGGQTSFF